MINVRNTRRLAALTALVLVLLAGCGQSGASPDTPPSGHAPEETETAQTASPSDETAAQTESPSQNEADTAVNRGGTPVDALPEDLPEKVTFCSGAGAWRTNLSLACDGSFTGQFTDWDAGSDPTYPGGLYRICTFSGAFSDLCRLDGYSYSMVLEDLICQETQGEEWVEDGTRYIGSSPYGLEGGTVFYLYTPETSTDVLTTEALQVGWPEWNLPDTVPEGQLGCWMLYNQAMDQAFFSYE